MDEQTKEYVNSGKHLPSFMQDFHDQKELFQRVQEFVKERDDNYTKEIDWTTAQVYTIDYFLWYMAMHGYTLQRSRKKVPFYDIDNDLGEFRERKQKESVEVLKSIFNQHKKKNK